MTRRVECVFLTRVAARGGRPRRLVDGASVVALACRAADVPAGAGAGSAGCCEMHPCQGSEGASMTLFHVKRRVIPCWDQRERTTCGARSIALAAQRHVAACTEFARRRHPRRISGSDGFRRPAGPHRRPTGPDFLPAGFVPFHVERIPGAPAPTRDDAYTTRGCGWSERHRITLRLGRYANPPRMDAPRGPGRHRCRRSDTHGCHITALARGGAPTRADVGHSGHGRDDSSRGRARA